MAMAMAIPNAFHCPKSPISSRNRFLKASRSNVPLFFFSARRVEFNRFARELPRDLRVVCSASSTAGSSSTSSDENPYEVLGVSPIEGFDVIKGKYMRKRKDAERRGDEAYTSKLERAYDKIMMVQLTNRKKGLTFGAFKVSKDIKYADKQPIVPWGPRCFVQGRQLLALADRIVTHTHVGYGYISAGDSFHVIKEANHDAKLTRERFTKSSETDIRINMAISAFFTVWIAIQRNAEWKPLQFLGFVFVYRIFEKLKASEPPVSPTFTEDGEDEGRALRMGKRLLRSLSLVFGCMAVSSLAFTGVLNLIEFLGRYIPVFLYNNQEMFITASTAVMLHIMASYYR